MLCHIRRASLIRRVGSDALSSASMPSISGTYIAKNSYPYIAGSNAVFMMKKCEAISAVFNTKQSSSVVHTSFESRLLSLQLWLRVCSHVTEDCMTDFSDLLLGVHCVAVQ